jgi:hypothetical protein
MSGSPVISANGAAIGIVCTSAEAPGSVKVQLHGPNPSLIRDLPGWFLSETWRGEKARAIKAELKQLAGVK